MTRQGVTAKRIMFTEEREHKLLQLSSIIHSLGKSIIYTWPPYCDSGELKKHRTAGLDRGNVRSCCLHFKSRAAFTEKHPEEQIKFHHSGRPSCPPLCSRNPRLVFQCPAGRIDPSQEGM
ncbi:hypothetical protein Q7C36_008484 [Tachysurus vachellii]|uniref:Uncharacterized protein n=1 Tax=Tachysurus vachellii TaxID=175792 RepID=A0AA88N5Y5_TACVA|nr:hypothetical protein Q7C36_008484 [Tachysurus vachellii]